MAYSFKAIHSYSDPGLDKQKFYEYELSVRINAKGLSYCILDINTNKFLHLESFDLRDPANKPLIPGEYDLADLSRISQLLESELPWLSNPFSKTRVMLNEGKSTLVPDALFNQAERAEILNFNLAGGPYKEEDIHHDHLRSTNSNSIYHFPGHMQDLISKFFPDAAIYHHSAAIIQGLFLNYMNKENDRILYVNTDNSRLDIIRIKGQKLDYYNSFGYNTAEDFMYYLIFVVEQLKLNPETLELVMMGEVEKHSTLSDLLHKYIRNVSFIERNTDFRYSFVFDQLPGHYYFNLLNLSLCE